jgi:hypothetical protein
MVDFLHGTNAKTETAQGIEKEDASYDAGRIPQPVESDSYDAR